MADTVINCEADRKSTAKAMEDAGKMKRHVSDLYGKGDTSEQIVKILKEQLEIHRGSVKKQFYDLP